MAPKFVNKQLSVKLPSDLLDLIDQCAEREFATRKEWVREKMLRAVEESIRSKNRRLPSPGKQDPEGDY